MFSKCEGWTKEDYIREFRLMWEWIAEKTEERREFVGKLEYLEGRFKGYGGEDMMNDCFLCEFCSSKGCYAPDCDKCPIDWGTDKNGLSLLCDDGAALFEKWVFTGRWQEAAEYAREIAELPEKGDIE
ncbi:MAG: hypothetical protein LIO87_09210 [Eubacterium sp.]|nr:hypothetical protein [Eubacterium sp.]